MAEHRACWIDATAGIAGDMLMGALVDAGADADRISAALASLGVPALGVRVQPDRRGGFRCLRAHVEVPAEDPPRHRGLEDVRALVQGADLSEPATSYALRVFEVLAEAEGAVHGVPPAQVHFHEVGALDAVADVVGCAAALAEVGALNEGRSVACSPLAAGSGTARTEHGRLSVPVPAVLEIAARAGLRLGGDQLVGERTTPTGAALVAALDPASDFPEMTVRATGSGGGSHDAEDRPNITRVVLGTATSRGDVREHRSDTVVIETTVDDLDPQLWPSTLAAVRAAGAWDCWTTPTTGRNGRPGRVLTAMSPASTRESVVDAMFQHTGTFGVRWSSWSRATLPRTTTTVHLGPEGATHPVSVKVAERSGHRTAKPEPDDVQAAARSLDLPPRVVAEQALAALRSTDTAER